MPVLKTFVSYARADAERVRAVLRRAAPLGVRPWLDEHDMFGAAGMSLTDTLREAVEAPGCHAAALFLSEAAVRSGWVDHEIGVGLGRVPRGWRIIPIALDPIDTLALSENARAALRARDGVIDTIFVDAGAPDAVGRFAAAALEAAQLDRAKDVVLYLGQRQPLLDAVIPEPWEHLPSIDLRLHYPVGIDTFSPGADEWLEIERGLQFLKSRLGRVERLRLCGFAPLGVAAIAGRTWDRGTYIELSGWNPSTRAEWSAVLPAEANVGTTTWTPESAARLSLVARPEEVAPAARTVVAAFLNKADYDSEVRGWSLAGGERPVFIVRTPLDIADQEAATAVLAECVGAIRWIRREHPAVAEIDLVLTLPFALTAFFVHQLRQVGLVRYYDQIGPKKNSGYRLVFSWGE